MTIRPSADDHMLWMGDFNRHHPLWEELRNDHLFNYAAAQPLIDLIVDYGMVQLLPCGIPTLQATCSGNWTRPDNIFGTELLLDATVSCTTAPELCGPRTDHVPIHLILELETPRVAAEPYRNWREVDWKDFNARLSDLLSHSPPTPLASNEEFQEAAHQLTKTITEVIDSCVPNSKPCPHSKRWWTRELTNLRAQVNKSSKEAYLMRALPLHRCHAELESLKTRYVEEIASMKKQHWIEWLEDIEGNDLWTTNRYISSEPRDGGKTQVPSLKRKNEDNMITVANTNQEKSTMIAESFFPLPPLVDSTPADPEYPDPIAMHPPIQTSQISRAIAKLSGYKAPGPDGISNIVFKQCSDTLIPYLTHLFNAVFTHKTYYPPWKSFTTVVLRKPGKPDYTVPKAYRPIALLNSTCKLLTVMSLQPLCTPQDTLSYHLRLCLTSLALGIALARSHRHRHRTHSLAHTRHCAHSHAH